jgi:hypothetical protein
LLILVDITRRHPLLRCKIASKFHPTSR